MGSPNWALTLKPEEVQARTQVLKDLKMPKLGDLQSSGDSPIKTIMAGYRPYMPASAVYSYTANKDGMKGGSILVSPKKGKQMGNDYIAAGGQKADMDF